jgi:hypothetical protein
MASHKNLEFSLTPVGGDNHELYSDEHSPEAEALVVQSTERQARRIQPSLKAHADSVVVSRSFSAFSKHVENRHEGYQSLIDTYEVVVADVGRNLGLVEDMYWSDAAAVLHTNGPLQQRVERAEIPVSGNQVDGDAKYLCREDGFYACTEPFGDDAAEEWNRLLCPVLEEAGLL